MREGLKGAVSGLPGEARVVLGPTEYGNKGMMTFVITVAVGPPTPGNEEVVDKLFNDLPAAVHDSIDGTHVSRCSGHRLYANGPGDEPRLGAEWTVLVL
jgi:hypothetical protein